MALVKMKAISIGVLMVVLFAHLGLIEAEIYIVTLEEDPVVSYQGGVHGFEATASETDEKIDVTR